MIYTVTLNPAVDRELIVPTIEYDSVLRALSCRVDYGGKGFNVSRMLRSLGTASMALGFAGGRSGELLRDGLETLNINTDFVWIAGETRTNISIFAQAQDHYLKVNEPGPTIAAAEQDELIEKVYQYARPGDWWVLAGSLPPGVPPIMYRRLIEIIQDEGACVILDTSDEALREGCLAGPFLAKPNDVEIHKLTEMPVASVPEIAAAALILQQMGVSNVIVSLGKRGALLVTENQTWIAASPTIVEKNPIGAGDSMVGGLVWGLSQEMLLPEALCWGVACGAATASMSGTAVGSRELVELLRDQVYLTCLEPA